MRKTLTIVALLCFAVNGVSQSPKNAAKTEETKKHEQPAASPPSQTITIYNQPSSTDNSEAANQHEQEIEIQRQLARFTGWLVLVGFLQFSILGVQARLFFQQKTIMGQHKTSLEDLAKAANESAVVNKTTLVATFRPKVIVRSITLKPDKITYIITNQGGTKAHIMSSNITVTDIDSVGGWLPATPPYSETDNVLGKIALEPGDFNDGEIALETGIRERIRVESARARSGVADPGSVYCLGYIQYMDGNMVVRYTAFCRLFNVHRQRFVAVNDPDYEYAD